MTTTTPRLRLSFGMAVFLLLLLSATVAARPRHLIPTADNTPPTADFSIDPPQGVVGTMFFFDAAPSSDNEDSDAWLLARFDYETDGVWDTGWLNPTNPPERHTYNTPANYQIKLEIKDTDGLTATKTKTLHVGDVGNNTPPTARCSATPANGPPGTVFTFSAASSSDVQDPASVLKAKWDFQGSFHFRGQDWQPVSQTPTFQYNRIGLHRIDLIVIDSGYLIDNTSCQVEILPPGGNTPPTAQLVITPTTGTITTTFTFDASGSYDRQDNLSFMSILYDWADDGTYDTSFINAWIMQAHVFADVWGDITVRMQLTDSGGLTDEITRTVHVTTPYHLYLPFFRQGGSP